MTHRLITRKQFLGLTAAGSAGALLVACGAPAASPTAAPAATSKPAAAATSAPAATTAPAAATAKPAATTAPAATAKPAASAAAGQPSQVAYNVLATTKPAKFAEAPMLADLVKAGKLPPVEQRIPSEPLVIKPIEIGKYGGTLRTGDLVAGAMRGSDYDHVSGQYRPAAMRVAPDLANYVNGGGIAKEVKISDDKTTYTVVLRKGHKWSDGTPFTSKDVIFYWEDIEKNTDLNPAVPPAYRPGGKPAEVTAPDENTVVWKFAIPYPSFPLTILSHRMAWYKGASFLPAEFLKKYHPKYNPGAADDAKANKYENWFARFADLCDYQKNSVTPTLAAFTVAETTPSGVKLQRNPYYYAVDTEGNQLPYVDYHQIEYVSNVQMYDAKVVTGSYDFAGQNTSVLNYNAYQNGAKQGNYEVRLWSSGKGAEVYFNVNLTVKDETLRKIHQDVRFRKALSLAINRDEVNNLIFFGKAIPRQMTVLRSSKYFKPEYEKSFAQYDVKQANALLDELGLKWNADKTVRMLPNGQPMQYSFDFFEGEGPKIAVLEIIQEYWRKVGVNITGKSVTRQLLQPRVQANEEPMSLWHGDASSDVLLCQDRKWSSAKWGDESTMAPLWANWYETGGKAGEEPLGWFKPVFEAFTKYRDTLDPAAADQLLKLQAENLWSIGTCGEGPLPIVVKNTVGNWPAWGPLVWDGPHGWPYFSETIFLKS